eukprot:TRINITY_DN834_c0_g1_i2.p1 TRINITY_DN834_c0_g1~~TRINITY_DN834_c0_g1_i2.p1  ORF type:complete len:384 (+),score=28.71 TRINITY_DN834_c0_g1_i2:93-1244(+)
MFSPTLAKLSPYVPGEQPKIENLLKLNTNENPYPPAPGVKLALEAAAADYDRLRRYPDPESLAVREAVAAALGADIAAQAGESGVASPLTAENIFVGNGSDEVLALAFFAFFSAREGESLFLPAVSYSFYEVYCRLLGITISEIPVSKDTNWEIPLEKIAEKESPIRYSGAVLANPNAPTGHAHPADALGIVADRMGERVLLVDEAYHGFGAETAAALLTGPNPPKNLIITGTLSKSRSLAGIRIGYAAGPAPLIAALNAFKDSFNSYPVDAVAAKIAVAALSDRPYYLTTTAQITATRATATATLKSLNFQPLPSAANFIMTRPPIEISAEKMQDLLRKKGIIVRYFNRPDKGIDGFLRISIGTDAEMERLFDGIRAILAEI